MESCLWINSLHIVFFVVRSLRSKRFAGARLHITYIEWQSWQWQQSSQFVSLVYLSVEKGCGPSEYPEKNADKCFSVTAPTQFCCSSLGWLALQI